MRLKFNQRLTLPDGEMLNADFIDLRFEHWNANIDKLAHWQWEWDERQQREMHRGYLAAPLQNKWLNVILQDRIYGRGIVDNVRHNYLDTADNRYKPYPVIEAAWYQFGQFVNDNSTAKKPIAAF